MVGYGRSQVEWEEEEGRNGNCSDVGERFLLAIR
jgi:hypothetical protein